MRKELLNQRPTSALRGQAPLCKSVGTGHTSTHPSIFTKVLLVLLTMLLLPSAAWGETKTYTYNFSQTSIQQSDVDEINNTVNGWKYVEPYNYTPIVDWDAVYFTTGLTSFTSPINFPASITSVTIKADARYATEVTINGTKKNLSANSALRFDASNNSYAGMSPQTLEFTSITLDSPGPLKIEFSDTDEGLLAIESITIVYEPETYPITIAGIAVTNENASNITGTGITGKVSFTPAGDTTPATLTLVNATIIPEGEGRGISYTGTDNLTISLKGSNTVKGVGGCNAILYDGTGAATPTLTFTNGGTEPCSLQLETVGVDLRTIGGFEDVSCATGLYRIDDTAEGDAGITYKTTITSLGGGSGSSSDDPIIIKTAEDLRDFAKLVNRGTITNEYIKLNPEGGELDCNGLTGFEPIGILINSSYNYPFIGKFDGNNCTIKNLTYSTNGTGDRVGLFGYVGNEDVSDTKIEKLTLSNCSFNGGEYVGGIVGELKNGTIENCVLSSCTVKSGNAQIPYAGGIAGYVDNGTISTCTFNNGLVDCTTAYDGEPSNGVHAGGIVGAIETENSDIDVTVSSCIVSSTNVKGVHSGAVYGPYKIYVGGLVGRSLGTVKISDNKVTTTDKTKKISCQSGVDYTEYLCGAIIGEKGDETTLTNNTYEYDVTTEIAETPKSGYTQRGIGQDSYDIPNQVMMAGTKKVNISVTGLSGDRTLNLSEEMGSTYCLDERDASTEQLTTLYVLPRSTISLDASSEEGYKPTFTLSNSDVIVTPTENKEDDFWEIKYEFSMPEDDVTATIAFARDLGSQLYTLKTEQEAYTYTGKGIEPRISLTISTDPQNPVTVTLSKDTDFEIQKCMKDVDGTFTPIFEEDGKTPKTPVDAGSYKVYISGIGSYTGEAVLEFSITKATTDECIWFYHLVDGKEETVQDVEDATYGTAYDAPKLKNPLNLAVTLSCNAENGSNGTASDVATIDDEGNITILKAGTVYVYAVTEGNENYEAGEVHYQLDIEKGSLENVTITEIDDQVYTGTAIEPELTVTTPDGTSVTTDDYGIGYTPDNTNVGEVTITLTAKEGSEKFTESTTTTFNIIPPTPTIAFDNTKTYLNTDKIAISIDEAYATSSATAGITNTIYYSWDENPVTGTEYSEGGVAAQTGTLTAWVSAAKSGTNYESEKTTQAFTVKKDIASCTVTLPESATYTGAAFVPVVEAPNGATATPLTEGTDYTVSYQKVAGETATDVESMIDAGTYKITITGKGNYGGTKEISEFQIAQARLADAAISKLIVGDKEYEYDPDIEIPYTGEAIQPEVVVVFNDGTVTVDASEYTVSYGENNTEVSNETAIASVTVTSTNNNFEEGTFTSLNFKIVPAPVTITAAAQTVTYNAQQQAYTGASADNENVTLAIAYYPSEEERTTGSNALAGAPTDAGTYYVSVTLNEESQQHYTAKPANVTFTIAQLDISEAVITLDNEELTYNGEEQSVKVTKVMVGDIEVAADYYEKSGNSSGTEAGNYTLIVTAKLNNSDGSDFKNNFKGSAEKAWKIINHRTIPAKVIAEKFTSEGQTYATFYDASESFLAPQGIVAYIITGVSGNSVTVKAVSYIKAGTPVLLQKTSTSTETEETTDDIFATNILKYAEVDVTANGGQYVLYKNEFVKATGSITSGKCYLEPMGTFFAGTRGFSIAGGAEGTTAISDAVVDSDHSEWFDLQGRKIEKPSKKGLYIRDGKKIVVK